MIFIEREDLTQKKFGKLTVVEMLYNYNGTKVTKCRCNCDCGNKDVIRIAYELKKATDSSCGCARKEYSRKHRGTNVDKKQFGKLFVLETLWDESPVKVKCKCECGKIGIYTKRDVVSGHTKSCGCYSRMITGESNFVDHSGFVSDYGVMIINPAYKNKRRQWVWNCECGFCKKIFQEIPARILNNHIKSCGCLRDSAREVFIENLLIELKVNYKTEYTFQDLLGKGSYPLRFDFAVFDHDSKLKCLIEYDGKQHFESVKIFGGEESFERNIKYDALKNNYCERNGISLYRIPYTKTEKEIREIITNIINP